MEKRIYTEEPEEELWRLLLQYSYKAKIKKYFEEHDKEMVAASCDFSDISNSISGAILQAYEYYKASKVVSLQVKPLQLYYGITNLLFALTILMTGKIPDIHHHGMKIEIEQNNGYIADTFVLFNNPEIGGIHQFARIFGTTTDLCTLQKWNLKMFFDSIAEISDDFKSCYNEVSKILLLNVINTPDSRIEIIHGDTQAIIETLENVEGLSASYLKPQTISNNVDSPYVLLRHKINGQSIMKTSYSGRPYLQAGHKKAGKIVTLPNELNLYVSLFALSTLCRYHPAIWNQFVTQDSSGEKGLVEKVLYYSRRIIPNIVLNHILGCEVSLVSDRYVPEDRIHWVSEHEVKEIVEIEIQKHLKKEQVRNVLIKGKQ